MKGKIPYWLLLTIGWILVIVFGAVTLYVKSERWSNMMSDAFGASLSIVLVGTLTIIILKIKRLLK
jgi:membrane protein YdbS with pleckstrin-like domain